MMTGIWPEDLRIPFHTVGSVLYFGGAEMSYRWLRVFGIFLSLFILVLIQALDAASRAKTHAVDRFQGVLSRIFYGAMYTIVVYQCGTMLGEYKSCSGTFGAINDSRVCKFVTTTQENATNASSLHLVETSFEVPLIIVVILVLLWAFQGSLHYTLYEKTLRAQRLCGPPNMMLFDIRPRQ